MFLKRSSGFTLVELLVSIGIIGVLVALMIPAVQSSRESARRVKCQNNLKQIGIAVMQHVDVHKHFPTGGWRWRWAGDPDRGYGREQCGGWIYNILDFTESASIRGMGKGANEPTKRQLGKQAAETPLPFMICPTRRDVVTYPYRYHLKYYNIDQPDLIARSDYAASAGDKMCCMDSGPRSLEEGDSENYKWKNDDEISTGLIYQRSMIRQAQVIDGMSKTYVVGEKYLRPDHYDNGKSPGDDQGWNSGYVIDNTRWTERKRLKNVPVLTPRLDSNDKEDNGRYSNARFGSPHPGAMLFLFADGSARPITYEIEEEVHAQFGNRRDEGKQSDAALDPVAPNPPPVPSAA